MTKMEVAVNASYELGVISGKVVNLSQSIAQQTGLEKATTSLYETTTKRNFELDKTLAKATVMVSAKPTMELVGKEASKYASKIIGVPEQVIYENGEKIIGKYVEGYTSVVPKDK